MKLLALAAGMLSLSFAAAAPAAFKGTVALAVDATDVDHQIFDIRESIPVQRSGPMTLLYPQWEVASHAPTASAAQLAGVTLQVDGKPLAWKRDPRDPHAFHIVVPAGARAVDVRMQFLAPDAPVLLRPDMVSLPWHRLLLYPAGWPVHAIPVQAAVTLPAGLELAGPLDVASRDGNRLQLRTVTLDALVDAPAHAARWRRAIALAQPDGKPIVLDIVAGDAHGLDVPDAEVARLRTLVEETGLVFGPAPFKRYHVLAILDDATAGGGIEHREEAENFLPANFFNAPDGQLANADLLAHEYVHAWNGLYRIPADLWTKDYNTPAAGSLLWVYEGQTETWGRVLAARTGARSMQQTLDRLAIDAASVANRPARAWKSLADSTIDPVYVIGQTVAWRDWQRREDYYPEGVLLWLDVEARLRELSAGRVGLDDFARRFFAVGGRAGPALYTEDDVVRTLDGLAPQDWRAFLDRHLESHRDEDAMAGLARAGWRLVYRTQPTDSWRQEEAVWSIRDLSYSIGLQVRANGALRAVAWNGPAFRAGLAPNAQIVSVNGAPFTPERIEDAVAHAADVPVVLEVAAKGTKRSITLPYGGTLRYPALERIEGTPDRLTPWLAPRRKNAS
jgi:predicted metalloprotease with PDZ domain